jgi:hypothetical protein
MAGSLSFPVPRHFEACALARLGARIAGEGAEIIGQNLADLFGNRVDRNNLQA